MDTLVSIIIPCFNSEVTLEATLTSVYNQEYHNWEAIIINDGSTDTTEKIAKKWLEIDSRFKYYSKQNEGLGKTRNYGISKANGIYILPLDSDNLVIKDFAKRAVSVFDKNPEIAVVHGHAEYFGEKTGIWKIDNFNLDKMLMNNYIDACAIYKKSIWQQVGGYDIKMPYQGIEDWDLWLSFGAMNLKFYHLKQITFKYYVHKNSMIRSFSDEMFKANHDYVLQKHHKIIFNRFVDNTINLQKLKKNPILALYFYFKSFF